MDADVREWCRCGVLVFECGRGTTAQHDERIKALADRELARRPAAPAFERDEFLRVVALSPQAAQAFAGREDEPEDLGPPVYPDRYAPGARVWGFRAVACAVTVTASNAEPSGLALVRERMSALDAALRVVLDAAEAAIDAHPGLTRAMRSAPAFTAPPYTAEVSRCRLGYTVACQVYGDNKRTRTPTRITGFGETLADAIAAFEGGLDAWAAVLK